MTRGWSEELLFGKVLIANRGEIAIRVMRACRDLGIQSVAIYGDGEQDAPHVRYADEAFRLDSAAPIPYLDIDAILQVAGESSADAIHPGYGFLSENAEFADRCSGSGLVFIGPAADAMASMGDKIRARQIALKANVPLIPGSSDAIEREDVESLASEIGYPVAIKAAAGGGGRGFRVANSADELQDAVEGATGEAQRYFSDSRVFLERYLESPRHVEIQILADHHGTVVALGERDCSVQRRHQKLIEEAPSPILDDAMRSRMEAAAIELARTVNYVSAGTVEFMVQGDEFYFLEMNTRIQVEHPVTEMITGVDLVCEQIRIAAGKKIDPALGKARYGHALECRINAEDVAAGFQPVSGTIASCSIPLGPGVRLDGVIEPGSVVSPRYDSLLGKLVTWGVDRDQSVRRMQRALSELNISGIASTAAFHQVVMAHPVFQRGEYDTRFLERYPEVLEPSEGVAVATGASGGLPQDAEKERILVEVNGRRFDVHVYREPTKAGTRTPPRLTLGSGAATVAPEGSETIVSPIQGTVLSVSVSVGDTVRAGDVICTVEAMKMENEISAGRDGIVTRLEVHTGESIDAGAVIAVIESDGSAGTPEAGA